MGVPSFFRWLIKRYPHVVADCVEEERLDSAAQFGPNPNGTEFDALYLDMNGIIHRASHPEDQPAPESEEAMMQAMFAFIDRLMNIVRPQKLLYIGIDGVAPRAKMNQQRSRRFLAAKHRLEEEAKAKEDAADSDGAHAEPTKPIFDHNVITPGTEFMSRVAEALRGHFAQKISADPNWSRLAVILSDACVPGEGEHKIMEFIRTQRTQEGYNANAPIAVYGLDADLIFLTLAQHEPRFSILREEVSSVTCFVCHKTGHISTDCPQLHPEEHEDEDEDGKQGPPELKFQWLHSGVLREYLDREFRHLPLGFPYSLERIIDDWIVICFLAGNDFLPRLPSVAIHEGAIDLLTSAYKQLLPTLDGYICSNGNINFQRLAPIVAVVAESEEEVLIDRRKNFLRKQRQERAFQRELREGRSNDDGDEDDEDDGGRRHHGKAKEAGGGHRKPVHYRRRDRRRSREDEAGEIEATYSDDDEDDEDEDSIRIGESGWRDRYLLQKFGVPSANREFYQGVVRAYVEGLQWVARYYWQGCVSWKWFYAYHYPPMATMLADGIGKFRTTDVLSSFQLSRPFHPFAQLMAVLPAASAHALPAPCRPLMTSADSPIADFYPTNIEIDMDGVSHNMEWAGVVKLPFVDEARLLAVLEPLERQLTPDEVHRNSFGLPRLLLGPASPVHAAAKAKLAEAEARLTMADGDGFLAGGLTAFNATTGDVVTCDYSLPPRPAGEFVSGLLPTVILPEPRLPVLEQEEDHDGEDDGQEGDRHSHHGGAYRGGRGGRGGSRGRAGRGRGRQHQDDPTDHHHQNKRQQQDEAHGGGGHHQAAAHPHHQNERGRGGGHHHAPAHNQRGDW